MSSQYLVPSCELGFYAGIANSLNITLSTPLECLPCSSHFARCADVIFNGAYDCHSSSFTTSGIGKIVGLNSCFDNSVNENGAIYVIALYGGILFILYLLLAMRNKQFYTILTFVMPIMIMNAMSASLFKYIIIGLTNLYEPVYSDYSNNICTALIVVCYTMSGLIFLFTYIFRFEPFVEIERIIIMIGLDKILSLMGSTIAAVLLTLLYYNVYLPSINNITIFDVDAYGFKTDGVVNLTFNSKFKIWIFVNLCASYFAFLLQCAYMVYLFCKKRQADHNNRIMNDYNSIVPNQV